ncbi:FHA domain-containing protein [Anaeromyxobacter diazotrophicus]|uniref:FHA domain-containing protein n=1 Tax=Anaeromyxobacter diazotrophicus TaxID=2590199 RepID=A0A7I9VNQ7_9BACT|nr:FHA domain-containing protein [Anaeromyxobacter diazotrophicus]GEJ58044.1 hypothetical protein AMYX_27850 [Anaeromyxobacter diazotrophicus]
MAAPPESTRALLAAILAPAPRPPEGAGSGSWLVAIRGPGAGDRLALRDGAVLGRGRAADLRLRDGRTSRSHARFTRAGASWRVHDLGSKNGVRVNGRPAARSGALLAPGDRLAVGDSLLLFEPPAAGPARALAPVRAPAPAGAPPVAARRPAALAAAWALLACAAALAAAAR